MASSNVSVSAVTTDSIMFNSIPIHRVATHGSQKGGQSGEIRERAVPLRKTSPNFCSSAKGSDFFYVSHDFLIDSIIYLMSPLMTGFKLRIHLISIFHRIVIFATVME